MPHIMILEDDATIREELCLLLQNAGYRVTAPDTFDDSGADVARAGPDLLLLDIGLPGQDGYALCAAIRKTSQLPILFLTSRSSSMDELRALSLGGDDFISKPYNVPVLLARIAALLRRGAPAQGGESVSVNGLTLHLSRGVMQANGQSVELTKNEAGILYCLMQRPGEIIQRADIIEHLWDTRVYIDDNTLSVNITRLRAKLREIGMEDYIQTKRGMGYKL